MNKLLFTLLICLLAEFTIAQKKVILALRGGATFTNSTSTLPAHRMRNGFNAPETTYHSDGLGLGAVAGVLGRVHLGGFFVQIEANYLRFAMKQHARFVVDLSEEASAQLNNLAGRNGAVVATRVTLPANTVVGSGYLETINTIDAVNVPIMVGKSFGNLRVYGGPSVLFVSTSEQVFREGKVSATKELEHPDLTDPRSVTVHSYVALNSLNAIDKKIDDGYSLRRITVGAEVGAGVTLPMGLELDLRYTMPVTLHHQTQVKGFVGITSLTLGVHVGK